MKVIKDMKVMKNTFLVTSILAAAIATAWTGVGRASTAALRIVATTEDLGSLANEVGGDRVTVVSLAKGYQDPHQVDPKPSFILEISRADLLIAVGRELEIGWLPALQTSSRNAKIQVGGPGYLDASQNVRILEIPTGQITRAMGDVHPQGNPHYWLDPANGRKIAQAIRDRLTQLAPGDKAYFDQRYADFDKRLAAAEQRWDATMAPYKGAQIVTYHRSWPNFMERFGLQVMGYVEPKPGIPAPPAHIIDLIGEMKRTGARLIIVEPYWSLKTPQSIASQTGGQVLVLAPSVGGVKEATDYIKLFDYDVSQLASALKQTSGK
ncbi:MAG: metal ABC transporter substrate-binding protein [Acidobacteriota bacterium]